MAFHNYVLITLVVLLVSLLFVSSKRKIIKKPWLNKMVNTFVIIIAVFFTLIVTLFPELGSVKTTGVYPITSIVMELTDHSRLEEFNSNGGFRKLSVLVYFPDVAGTEDNTYPLVIFSHGGISTKTSNLSLYKELASHGFVVVSIDHTYHSIVKEINRKKIYIDLGYLREINTENSHTDINKSYEYFKKWMQLRTEDINFVIDTFIQKSIEKSNTLYALIDSNNIGAVGHSLGGSAVLGVARQRAEIKAIIALESPYFYDITGIEENEFTWNTNPYSCFIMNIYSENGYPLITSDNKYRQNKNYLYNSEYVDNYYIEGSNHFTLTDLVRKSPILCALLGGGYKKPGYATLEFINTISLAFLNTHLKSNY